MMKGVGALQSKRPLRPALTFSDQAAQFERSWALNSTKVGTLVRKLGQLLPLALINNR